MQVLRDADVCVVDADTADVGEAAGVDTDTDGGAHTHKCRHSMGTGASKNAGKDTDAKSNACLDKGADADVDEEAGADIIAKRPRRRCSGRCLVQMNTDRYAVSDADRHGCRKGQTEL